MSYTNGYANGAYGVGRYEEAPQYDSERRGSHTHRAGGYGGFHDNSLSVPSEPEAEPPPPQQAFRRRGADDYDSSRSRDRGVRGQDTKLYGNGPGSKQIEGVLDHIRANWDVMIQDDCVPVHVALQLMDYSSLGRGDDYQDFQRTNKHLQKALKTIVNEHHQGFNSSIGTFHKIQASILASQSKVRALRDSVQGAKSNFLVTKPELKLLGTSSQQYDEMILILGQIEKLQLVPEQLDARISDKHFLPAIDLLQSSLRMIRRSDVENLGALADLRIYFSNQETSLIDILIEELHDHIYLKSPYCHNRWQPYMGDANTSTSEIGGGTLPNTWGRPLYIFLDSLDNSLAIEDNPSQNPETDSFQYIRMVLESLNKLGHLDLAIDRMEERLPVELFAIVERTNQEVGMRHKAHTQGPRNLERWPVGSDSHQEGGYNEVLNDLLWTLYSKFEAIAEGHRAVHEVVAGIIKREGIRQSETLLRGFKEMWKLYQSEVSPGLLSNT